MTLPAIGQVPPASDDKSTPAGVSVPDSPGASERLDKARDKESQKQWKTAVEFYQEALTQFPGRVVPVKRDLDKGIYQYAGIAPIVQERLAKWPADGIKIYNNLYGQTAADLLAAAAPGDTAALRNIFWNYFITDAGKTAGIRLIDNFMESGDFQAALWTGDRLLTWHPALLDDRAMIRYRTALAAHWLGDSAKASAQLTALKSENPAQVSSIGGKDVLLVDSLAAAISAPVPAPTTRPTDADTYPSFGGAGGRGDISPSSAKPGASLNSVQLTPPEYTGLMGNQRSAYQQNDQLSLTNDLAMGMIPVVDAGSLFFQDGRCVYAVDADSGSPLTGWLNTYGGERAGRYKLNTFGRARDEQLTITVTPSSVLAVMGQPDHGGAMAGQFAAMAPPQTSSIKLVCLDRDTGRERWTRTPAELPESAAALRTGDYCGTPLVIPAALAGRGAASTGAMEDSVLVVARGGTDNQFDDCYLVCLSLKTGQYRWSTYVGSATRNFDMEGFNARDPSQIALANGRVFVMTNLGIVAALDPSDGRVIWLNSYTRENSDNPEAMFLRARRFNAGNPAMAGSGSKVWAHNPLVVSDGSVFALPDDSRMLFVYDAGSGEQQNRLPMSAYDNADVMLGVRDGGVCLTTDKGVAVVDWKKYDEDNPKNAVRWNEADITSGDQSTICGRGFITADSIFVPTKNRLRHLSWKSGKIIAPDYPARGSFNPDQGPGNMLVTAHNVVVAGQTRVDVYTDLALVRQKFETAIAAAPTDPQPRVKYAEALFAGGQVSDAMDRIDQAIDLLGGKDLMRSGSGRSMIFTTMLDFARRAERNADKSTKDQNIAQENELFDRAKIAADSPLEQATYRLARAKFNHTYEDYTAEVTLCQEILSDPVLRNISLSDENTAGAAAELAIEGAIHANRSSYAAVEQQAGDALKQARGTNEPNDLLNVAVIYPNSAAAIDARQEAVHRFEAANQPEKAIDVLRRMYLSATDTTTKSHLLESISGDFLLMPDGLGPAVDRLCRASRITSPDAKLSQKLLLTDGTTLSDITFGQAIMALRKMQADQETARLPDFHLPARTNAKDPSPFMPGAAPTIANVMGLVHPLRDFNRLDQILTWSAAGLSIYPVGQTTPLASIAAVDVNPIAAAWANDNWIVWTTNQIFQIGGDGKSGWSFSVEHLPEIVVSTGGDSVVVDEVTDNPGGDDVVNVNNINNPRVMNLRGVRMVGGGGGFRVRPLPPPEPIAVMPSAHNTTEQITAVQPAGAQLMVSTSTGRIVALDSKNGQIRWQTRPVDHAADQLLANPHFTVVRMDDPSGSEIAVYDTPTGRVIGRRRFGPDSSQTQLVNVALSEEATLAITLTNRVEVKDLYDAWKLAPVEQTSQANRDNAPFVGLNQPDQLLVKGGRLACLYDGGMYVHGYDLSQASDPTLPLDTKANTADVSLQMVGPRLFVQTDKGMRQYNLADKTDHYAGDMDENPTPTKVTNLLLGKDYAIVLLDPVDRGPLGSPLVTLMGIRRSLVPNTTRENGSNDWAKQVTSPAGITDWIAAQGTVYYLTKDGNLHALRGARP